MQRPKLTFPDDVAKYVTEAYERHDSILEYGSGGSTVLASVSWRMLYHQL